MKIKDKTIVCDECGWKWKLSDGGKDPYMCHKCGHNNKSSNGLKIINKATKKK